jgi:cytochrome c-type biogenesis protein
VCRSRLALAAKSYRRVLFARLSRAFAAVKRHYPVIIATGGAVLIAMGVLIWTGELFQLNIQAQELLDRLGIDFFNSV